MKTRKLTIALMAVLGIWHSALAYSPGGEEKGGKGPEKVMSADKHRTAAQGMENVANLALQMGDDQAGAEAPESVSATNTHSSTGSSNALAMVIEQRKAEQSASMERTELRKSLKASLKNAKKARKDGQQPASPFADDMMIICVILCFFIPPLAVYLWENSLGINFWISLILTLLFWLPGVIFSLIVVLTT